MQALQIKSLDHGGTDPHNPKPPNPNPPSGPEPGPVLPRPPDLPPLPDFVPCRLAPVDETWRRRALS